MKKFSLLFLLALCSLVMTAQNFRKSYQEKFMQQLYEFMPDSLKDEVKTMKTPVLEYQPEHIKDIGGVKKLFQRTKSQSEIMGFISEDVYIAIWEKVHKRPNAQAGFDFWYINPQNQLCCFRAKDISGKISRSFKTKSGKTYEVEHCWGFLNITENRIPILSCHCEVDKSQEDEACLKIIPFDGTNIFYWSMPMGDSRVPLF